MTHTAEDAWKLSVELQGLIRALGYLAFEYPTDAKEQSRARHALVSTINAAEDLSNRLDSMLDQMMDREAESHAG
jgi:hypothetical protein